MLESVDLKLIKLSGVSKNKFKVDQLFVYLLLQRSDRPSERFGKMQILWQPINEKFEINSHSNLTSNNK